MIQAIPAAAAVPDRIPVGIDQKHAKAESTPAVATVRQAMPPQPVTNRELESAKASAPTIAETAT